LRQHACGQRFGGVVRQHGYRRLREDGAIDAGCPEAGCTVHQVTAELDHGPILAQAAVPVLPDDTAETLAARVLAQEHLLYPQAVRGWLESQP
ncbi:MAG: hypothetical protein EON92_16660, partial [Burkholderiales bacterium]